MEDIEPVRRTLEIEEVTNRYVVHPLASRLVPLFAALRISPNAVSMAGMAFGISAGVAYSAYQNPRCVIAGFMLMVAWHVMDGADGQLARMTHSQSQFGTVLDGICDYATFVAVYTGLTINLSRQYGDRMWLLVLAAGICHAVQAAVYERQRQEYGYWGMRRESAALLDPVAAPGDTTPAPPAQRLAAALHQAYLEVQRLASGDSVEFHERLTRALDGPPNRAEAVRRRYRETFAPLVRQWSVMSANYRTLGIFAFALAGAPQYYFWFEIIGFSAMSMLLLRRRRTRCDLFLEGLRPADEAPAALSPRSAEYANGQAHQQ
jgi:phosphatidylglycerophosphate synthase